jgi:hypothetical protein
LLFLSTEVARKRAWPEDTEATEKTGPAQDPMQKSVFYSRYLSSSFSFPAENFPKMFLP